MAKLTKPSSPPFKGYTSPKYTQIPDELFDEQLPFLSGAELKVLLYIMRRTFGFKKDSDDISFSQICRGITTHDGRVLDLGTGLSSSTAQAAIKGLTEKHIITATRRVSRERGNEPTTYALNLGTPYGENRHSPLPKIDKALWRKSPTQETVLQKTEEQHTVSNDSNDSHGRRKKGEAGASWAALNEASRHPTGERAARGQSQRLTGFTPVGAIVSPEGSGIQNGSPALPERDVRGNSAQRSMDVPPDTDPPVSGDPEGAGAVSSARTNRRQRAGSLTPELDAAVETISTQLGDWRHLPSNRSQAHNMMAQYDASEQEVAEALFQAYSRSKEAAPKRPMAWCFVVAHKLLAGRPKKGRKDLVGKYAGVVRS